MEGLAFKRHLMIRLIGFKYRRGKSSSLQSLERGKKTEIRYLNGYIVELGRKHGIETPINSRIVELVEEIENGQRKIEYKNFNDLAFNRF
jgi:2-dehydropantoate 2-reductase